MVEAGIARGLNVIDAFSAATGNRTLNRAHKKELATQKSARRKYRTRLDSFRLGAVAGGGIAFAGGTVAFVSSNPALWFITIGGAVISLMSIRRWRRLGPEPVGRGSVAPATPLPRGAIGRDCVKRYLAVRTQVVNMSSSVSVLHPAAGKELVNADTQAAVALNALCDRLLVLHQLAASLPATAARPAPRAPLRLLLHDWYWGVIATTSYSQQRPNYWPHPTSLGWSIYNRPLTHLSHIHMD